MFKADRSPQGDSLVLVMKGDLDETVDLMAAVGVSLPKAVRLRCADMNRVNSVGLRNFLRHFEPFTRAGLQLTYSECSHAFANHLKTITAVLGGKIESVMAPFLCTKCNAAYDVLVKTTDIKDIQNQIAKQSCPKCKGPLKFDEIMTEYFSFLS